MDDAMTARLVELSAAMSASPYVKKSFRGMLYGPSGAGKSHLAIQIMDEIIEDDKGILHIDTSENWVVKDSMNLKHGFVHLPFTFIEDLRLIAEGIAQKMGPFAHVGAVILDEASSMSEDDLDRLYEQRLAGINASTIKMPALGVPDAPDWADFRPALQRFRSMLTELSKVSGLHIILVAHERQDAVTKYISPSFSPMIGKKIKAPLHLVGRLTAKMVAKPGEEESQYVREIQIHPTTAVDAKSRLGYPNVKYDPTYLPAAIKEWLNSGAIEYVAPDITVADPSPMQEKIQGLTISEVLEVADVDLDDVVNPFDPIS